MYGALTPKEKYYKLTGRFPVTLKYHFLYFQNPGEIFCHKALSSVKRYKNILRHSWTRKFGWAAFLFFLVKGLFWLAAGYLILK